MKNFIKNDRAATAIEFAIITPILFLLLLGMLEIGLTMFFQSCLDVSARIVARTGIQHGYDPSAADAQIMHILNDNFGGLYSQNADDTYYAVRSYASYDGLNGAFGNLSNDPTNYFNGGMHTIPPQKCNGGGPCQSGQIMVYGFRYRWGGVTKLFGSILPDYLYSFTVVRNQDF